MPTAILVAVATLLLRISFNYFTWLPADYFAFMISHRYSGAVYFLFLAAIFRLAGVKETGRTISWRLVFFLAASVTGANFVEAIVRVPLGEIITPGNLFILLIMSLVQVFFITSLVNISHFQRIKVMDEQERVSYEKMLIVASDLYDELFYMQKSTENIENVMAKSYALHKQLKEQKPQNPPWCMPPWKLPKGARSEEGYCAHSGRSLAGAGAKDSHRLYLSEILDLVIKTNRSYSQSLDKIVQFNLQLQEDMEIEQIYPLAGHFKQPGFQCH